MAYRLIRRAILLNSNPPHQEERKPKLMERFLMKAMPANTMHEETIAIRYAFPEKWLSIFILILALGMVFLFSGCVQASEHKIDDHKAILAIIGEAENQGFDGMIAIAHAIRNRGSLKGVFGLHAPRVKHHLYSRDILKEATLAWEGSATDIDITQGATGWGNSDDVKHFEMCRWWKHCVVTTIIKDHVFYKEQR